MAMERYHLDKVKNQSQLHGPSHDSSTPNQSDDTS